MAPAEEAVAYVVITKEKGTPPKHILRLPDLEQPKAAVLNSLTSKSGQLSYDREGTAPRPRGWVTRPIATSHFFCVQSATQSRGVVDRQVAACL